MNQVLDVIVTQSNLLSFNKDNFTLRFKLLVYKSFENMFKTYPQEMSDYLLNESRKGGFQNKLFKEYVRLVEAELPFSIRKNRKIQVISSLLDEDLNLFDGISTFTGRLNNKLQLQNQTKELYVGGRKATYAQPYYIGKILSVKDAKGNCITEKIADYSFSKITFENLKENDKVEVMHLRVVPHYQMGAMTHINRIRKSIVEELKDNSVI